MKILDILKNMRNPNYIWVDHYPEETEINLKEGLIKSTEVDKAVGILKKQFPTWSFQYDKDEPGFVLYVNKDVEWDKFKKFLILSNNLGYFPSYYVTDNKLGVNRDKYEENKIQNEFNNPNTKGIIISFEAKYDIFVDPKKDKIPDILYHVTPKENVDKILKIGLTPKSRSKKAFHPERVYLMRKIDDAEKLAKALANSSGNSNKIWTLLEIDISYLKNEYFKLYKDPNFKERGYYTVNNIPPQAIEKIKDIEL